MVERLAGSNARVAVVLPCFNEEAVEEAVPSILENAGEPIELVVVDDGSTDAGTVAALERLQGRGVRVLRQANAGQAAALMAGVAATSAPYVMPFDGDDLLMAGATRALADLLDEDPAAAFAFGDYETFGQTHYRVPSVPQLDPWLVTYVTRLPATSLFRRTDLLDAGGWQLREGFTDWDLWLALAERERHGVHLPHVVYRYRRDPDGMLNGLIPRYDAHYENLRSRHEGLFTRRPEARRRSVAPRLLVRTIGAVERLPVSRKTKVELCQLFTVLLWNRAPRVAAAMVLQAIPLRLRGRRRYRSGEPKA